MLTLDSLDFSRIYMSFQGVEFTPGMRQMVVNAKRFFDASKRDGNYENTPSATLTSQSLGVSISTVKVVMSAYKKLGENSFCRNQSDDRDQSSYSHELGMEPLIRQYIREANSQGRQVNIEIIRRFMRDELNYDMAHTTLWRTLQRWGFEFGRGIRSARLKESDRIIIMRRQYLREKRKNRDQNGNIIRPEVYLDESYINKNHSNDHTWYPEDDGPIIGKPTGKGERLIIVNAITKDGWVPNCKLVFQASRKTGDYHTNMNWGNFSKWFQESLLKNIPDNSIIIMDNAPYHNVFEDEAFPKKSHSVRRFREWLSNNKVPWTADMLKEELFELCSRLAPKPEYAIDKIAKASGHTILRTPPYHPELQPIETCWAVVKNHVAKHNDCTMKKVWSLLDEGFEKVTSNTCQKLILKAVKQEDLFWQEDKPKMPEI
jgi:transposase